MFMKFTKPTSFLLVNLNLLLLIITLYLLQFTILSEFLFYAVNLYDTYILQWLKFTESSFI